MMINHYFFFASQALNSLSEVCSGIFGVGAEFFFNPEELVILSESLRPAGSSSLDLAGAQADHQVGNEAILGLPGPVGHHRAPALALSHVVGLDRLSHASDLVHLKKVPQMFLVDFVKNPTFSRRPLQAFLSIAVPILLGFVTSKSSPTICIWVLAVSLA